MFGWMGERLAPRKDGEIRCRTGNDCLAPVELLPHHIRESHIRRNSECLVQPPKAQVGIHKKRLRTRKCKSDRQIRSDRGLAFAWSGTRHKQGLWAIAFNREEND